LIGNGSAHNAGASWRPCTIQSPVFRFTSPYFFAAATDWAHAVFLFAHLRRHRVAEVLGFEDAADLDFQAAAERRALEPTEREALAILDQQALVGFGCVLMDVQMREMDGFECTSIIREREQVSGSRLPIIAMTAHAMKGDDVRCLAAGMDGYLSSRSILMSSSTSSIGISASQSSPFLGRRLRNNGISQAPEALRGSIRPRLRLIRTARSRHAPGSHSRRSVARWPEVAERMPPGVS
jgi:CheY-like chemotaxis protein